MDPVVSVKKLLRKHQGACKSLEPNRNPKVVDTDNSLDAELDLSIENKYLPIIVVFEKNSILWNVTLVAMGRQPKKDFLGNHLIIVVF